MLYTRHMTNTQRHGMFITTQDPSPMMMTVMEKIQRQMQAEHEYRQAVRAGRIEPVQSTNWNISDRHWAALPVEFIQQDKAQCSILPFNPAPSDRLISMGAYGQPISSTLRHLPFWWQRQKVSKRSGKFLTLATPWNGWQSTDRHKGSNALFILSSILKMGSTFILEPRGTRTRSRCATSTTDF